MKSSVIEKFLRKHNIIYHVEQYANELTLEKLLKIDKKLEELQNLRNQLHHLSKNCSGDDRPECPILDALAKENQA